MAKKKRRSYARLSGVDRIAIQHALDEAMSFNEIARLIHRPVNTIAAEVKRNRTIFKGELRGEPVGETPSHACDKLKCAPWVCNGCRKHMNTCGRPWRCEYNSVRASKLSQKRKSESRRGIDRTQEQMERAMATIRKDLERGLPPCQIAEGRSKELHASPSTIYRWIDKGYCGLSSLELRRKVAYKPRAKKTAVVPTAHGEARSYKAFRELGDETVASACEMDTVIGSKFDRRCILTLYLRPSKFQFALLLDEKTSDEVVSKFDMLEALLGKAAFIHLFGLVITDNGTEFHQYRRLEKSVLGATKRTRVYYCDARQSQQKAGCERNHVELRKLLPKRTYAFDSLQPRDMAVLMSQMNSQPRPSLGGLCPIDLLKAQFPEESELLLDGLGVERIPFKELNLTSRTIDEDRRKRGASPLERA